MLLIYLDENALSESEREQCWEDSAQFAHELNGGGQSLAAAPLDPSSTATSVRVCDGKRQVTDGPCAETREQLGRYFLIDARDLDEAIGIQQGVGEPLKSGRSWRSRACRWIDWFDFNRSEQFRAPGLKPNQLGDVRCDS